MGERMALLRFLVRGSAIQPYRITMEGEGEQLRCFCSCPAGRKGATFCKHVAGLLKGDFTKLEREGSSDPDRIAIIAEGSGLVAKSLQHVPRATADLDRAIDDLYRETGSFALALEAELDMLRREGWIISATEAEIEACGRFKNEKPRRTPSAVILWRGDDRIVDGILFEGNKERPFYVSGSTFRSLAAAYLRFKAVLDKNRATHLP